MRWVEITDTTGRVVWINAQNVAYVQDFQTYRAVHFVGSKDNYFQAKDTAEDLVMMLRPPARCARRAGSPHCPPPVEVASH